MLHTHHVIRTHIYNKLGITESKRLTLDEIFNFKWSYAFLVGMVNRLLVGGYRHGLNKKVNPEHFLNEAKRRIDLFIKTENPELLFDAANFIMLVYRHGNYEGKKLDTYNHEHYITFQGDYNEKT